MQSGHVSSPVTDDEAKTARADNTEYNPARCRITRPAPPKPAQNPLQFVKIGPCALYRSAQEQLKKVEVIKSKKSDFRTDAEDWQQNLDYWKNSRRKRQEHIIERVVEIKNMEQEKTRRKSKTFSEMLEERMSRRGGVNKAIHYEELDDENFDTGILADNKTPDTKPIEPDKDVRTNDEQTDEMTNNNDETKTQLEESESANINRSRTNSLFNFANNNAPKTWDRRHSVSCQKPDDACAKDMPKIDISERKRVFEMFETHPATDDERKTVTEDVNICVKDRVKSFIRDEHDVSKRDVPLDVDISLSVKERVNNLCSQMVKTDVIHANDDYSDSLNNNVTKPSENSSPDEVIELETSNFDVLLQPTSAVEPPKEKPPPPPPVDDDNAFKRMNSTKRIKNDLLNKRTSFLGLDASSMQDDLTIAKPPDAASILQEELQLEKQLFKKQQSQSYHNIYNFDLNTMNNLNTSFVDVESRDSGVDLESRSDIADRKILTPDSTTSSLKHEEDEISKKEREIIEKLEKEEQWRGTFYGSNDRLDNDFAPFPDKHAFECRDEDVLRVERELLQLEKEERERQKEEMLIHKRKLQLLSENYDINLYNSAYNDYYDETAFHRGYLRREKTEPAIHRPTEYSNEVATAPVNDATNLIHSTRYYSSNPNVDPRMYSSSKSLRYADAKPKTAPITRQSLHVLSAAPKSKLRSTDEWIQSHPLPSIVHPAPARKLMNAQHKDYNQHWLVQEAEQRCKAERYARAKMNSIKPQPLKSIQQSQTADSDVQYQNVGFANLMSNIPSLPKPAPSNPSNVNGNYPTTGLYANEPQYMNQMNQVTLPAPSHARLTDPIASHARLNAATFSHARLTDPASTHVRMTDPASTHVRMTDPSSSHLRMTDPATSHVRLTELATTHVRMPDPASSHARLTDPASSHGRLSESASSHARLTDASSQICARSPSNYPVVYDSRSSNKGYEALHGLGVATNGSIGAQDQQEKMLSVSGKKKCSHCGDELGRGAAMIIESLCLFYHMTCFKCCVCHMQLGDGLIGTDVRVRNNKLHCQNCYSSDDGIKFSCV